MQRRDVEVLQLVPWIAHLSDDVSSLSESRPGLSCLLAVVNQAGWGYMVTTMQSPATASAPRQGLN